MSSIKNEKSAFTWRKSFNLAKDFFVNSDNRLISWLILIGSILCVLSLVVLMAVFSWWFAGFWTALMAKSLAPFLYSMGQFAVISTSFILVSILKNYLTTKLSISWRTWLTNKIIDKLFENSDKYLDLKRFSSKLDNVSQRIQQDIERYVNLSLTLSMDLLKSTASLVVFITTLWILSGILTVTVLGLNIIIPGFLVWTALAVALIATITTYYIGKPLSSINQESEQAEADFREELSQFNHEAENIAEEHAEHYYRTTLSKKITEINNASNKKLDAETKLISFQSFYSQLAMILPDLLAAPLYFAGVIELGQLMQVAVAFGQVSDSLSWFVNSYGSLADYKTSAMRIIELTEALENDGFSFNTNAKNIVKKIRDENSSKEWIRIKNVTIRQPSQDNTAPIIHGINLKLNPKEHVLIKGASGIGKSTLFKAISGTWNYGEGKISLPWGKTFYFLPQRPTLPHDTLKEVLAYPEPSDTYNDAQYIDALTKVGFANEFIDLLEEKRSWSHELSGGQQQRLAFARVILKKPDWLFLDEATSALDEESEEHIYNVAKGIEGATIVSIAHRSTVEKHHDRILFFKSHQDRTFACNDESTRKSDVKILPGASF